MADIKLASGGENTLIYRVKADHSAIVQSDGTTTATTNAHASLVLTTSIVKASFKMDKITLEVLKHDTLLLAAIKAYAAPFSSSEVDGEVVNAEAGTKHDVDAGSASGLDQLLIVYRGAANADGIKTVAALCTLDADARNFEVEYKKWSRKTLNFTPVNATAALAVVNGLLPTPAGYNVGATLTIPLDSAWEDAFLAAA